jgi:hypothetical protein
VKTTVQAAKDLLNRTFGREVLSGRNMGVQAREFSKEGLGSPTSLRDLYREITGNPREPLQLFVELTDKFRYDKMKTVITFCCTHSGLTSKRKGLRYPVQSSSGCSTRRGRCKEFWVFSGSSKAGCGSSLREFASYNLALPTTTQFRSLSQDFRQNLG